MKNLPHNTKQTSNWIFLLLDTFGAAEPCKVLVLVIFLGFFIYTSGIDKTISYEALGVGKRPWVRGC